jgi:hypothetical protein
LRLFSRKESGIGASPFHTMLFDENLYIITIRATRLAHGIFRGKTRSVSVERFGIVISQSVYDGPAPQQRVNLIVFFQKILKNVTNHIVSPLAISITSKAGPDSDPVPSALEPCTPCASLPIGVIGLLSSVYISYLWRCNRNRDILIIGLRHLQ